MLFILCQNRFTHNKKCNGYILRDNYSLEMIIKFKQSWIKDILQNAEFK
jgi:hypothetical protein